MTSDKQYGYIQPTIVASFIAPIDRAGRYRDELLHTFLVLPIQMTADNRNAIERITLGDDRSIVEHFNPGSTHSDGIPAAMGVPGGYARLNATRFDRRSELPSPGPPAVYRTPGESGMR